MSSYYDILCVPHNATEDEIRKAFRKQALLYHPDRNKSADATARFLMIIQAYEVLSDPNKRLQYNHHSGEYAKSIYDIPDYNTWKAQREEERKAEEQLAQEKLRRARILFQEDRYYLFRKTSIILKGIVGSIAGLVLIAASFYAIFITHFIIFFVVLPFICAGGLLSYFSYTWFTEKKKLF